ncbi:hypothetical protein B0H10DRAFT_2216922 [Mycena sp. CBHHK59/15]|nr:hypothetical protein B0H10DRAFT_2216922 [Mycena sp. CBHHK59/15]
MSRSTPQRSLLPDRPNKISVPLADIGDGSNFVSGSDDAPLMAPTRMVTFLPVPERKRNAVVHSPPPSLKNTKIYKMFLEESAFHYKSGRGVLFFEYFSSISLVTLALVLTAIEFCIEEYSTGRFQQGVFDELVNKDRYETHLKDLTDWVALKPDVTAVILQRMHDTCRAATGAALVKTTGHMTEAARTKALAELEAMNVDGSDNNDSDDE